MTDSAVDHPIESGKAAGPAGDRVPEELTPEQLLAAAKAKADAKADAKAAANAAKAAKAKAKRAQARAPIRAASAAAPVGPRKFSLVAAVAISVVAIDLLTKHWALSALQNGPIDVVGSLRWNLVYNTGAAFSLGSGKGLGPLIAVLAIVVVMAISLGFTSRFRLGAVAAGLIAGGAVGNLLDRAFRGNTGFLQGAVVDFIDLQWWPVFNIADASVSVGAGLLLLASLRVSAR